MVKPYRMMGKSSDARATTVLILNLDWSHE